MVTTGQERNLTWMGHSHTVHEPIYPRLMAYGNQDPAALPFLLPLPPDWFGALRGSNNEKADPTQRATEVTKKAVPSPVQGKQAHGSNSNVGYGFLCGNSLLSPNAGNIFLLTFTVRES